MTDTLAMLEALTGPDHRVDEWIWENHGRWPSREYRSVDYWRVYGTSLTHSLDAAASFAEKLGFQWLRKTPDTMTVYKPTTDDKSWAMHFEANGPTPAIALLTALFRASRSSPAPSNGDEQP